MADDIATNATGCSHRGTFCAMCQYPESDLQVLPCGCNLHARCVPIDIIIPTPCELRQSLRPNICPICNCGPYTSIELHKSSAEEIDRAVEIRRQSCSSYDNDTTPRLTSGSKHLTGTNISDTTASSSSPESSYLLLSSTYNPMEEVLQSSPFSDNDLHRTGRWTKEEVVYVDFLINSFEKGQLPIPKGISLKEFLCHKLLCRGSRLTKKLKKAKLSTRTYEIQYSKPGHNNQLDVLTLSVLQEAFLQSIKHETTQLAVRFYMAKSWKSLLSNLCIQVGYKQLNVTKWLESVESLDRKAAAIEEMIRSQRRKSVVTKMKAQVDQTQFMNIPTLTANPQPLLHPLRLVKISQDAEKKTNIRADIVTSLGRTTAINDASQGNLQSHINDFDGVFDDCVERSHSLSIPAKIQQFQQPGATMLSMLFTLLQQGNLPFHYVEIWAPSIGPPTPQSNSEIRLHHGGYTYRNDIDDKTRLNIFNFGEYRATLSIAPGEEIPGATFLQRNSIWTNDNVTDMSSSGIHGVFQTSLSIPIFNKNTQNVVLVFMFFALTRIPEDLRLSRQLEAELSIYSPKLKWTTVVDIGASSLPQDVLDPIVRNQVPNEVLAQMKEPSTTSYSSALPNERSVLDINADDNFSFSIGTNTETNQPNRERDDNMGIATLISQHMPNPLRDASSNAEAISMQDCISLRLLLLRPIQSRSDSENMVIELIRQSYLGYRSSQRWTEYELFLLLIKDWNNLRESAL